jgi:DNA-binding response OmpR family regulator
LLPETRTTVAILSGNPLVDRVLEFLLEDAGYEVSLLEELEAFRVEDLRDGVDVLLIGRGLGDDRREGFLRAVASTLETATIPVLALSPGPKGGLAAEDRLVPWPCRIEDLAREIDAAVLAAEGREPPDGPRLQAEEASAW